MIKKGVYAATLSVLKDDLSLDIEATISHAEWIIKGRSVTVYFSLDLLDKASTFQVQKKRAYFTNIFSQIKKSIFFRNWKQFIKRKY